VAADTVRRVEISDLKLGAVLGSGGQGQVVAIDNYQIDGKWSAALKTYKTSVNFNILEKIATFPDRLDVSDRNWLMGVSSWPWAIAMENGVARGFVMRLVPSVYQFNFMTIGQGGRARLSAVEFLLNSDRYVGSSGLKVTQVDRLRLLGSLAETMSRLHALGIVIGDLSPKNLLFHPGTYSSCFIIDCDAIALDGESALRQVDTPDWEVPESEIKGTESTDSYKFGLLAIRLFARDQSSHDTTPISVCSPEMGRLATLSQDHNPAARPSPGSWISPLKSAVLYASPTAASPQPAARPAPWSQAFNAGHPQPQPTPAHPVYQPPRTRRGGGKALALSGSALVALALIIIGVNASHHHTASLASGSTANSAGAPDAVSAGAVSAGAVTAPSSTAPAPAPEPTKVGVVAIGDNASGDPAATAVASMFNTYFSGIDNQDYQQTLSVFDPNGIVNPNDSSQAQSFINGVSTSSDSGETLAQVDPADGSTVQSAEVQFTSHQQAGYGPEDDPNATCTTWDITYNLTQDSSGNYLINSVSSASDSSC